MEHLQWGLVVVVQQLLRGFPENFELKSHQ